MHKNLSHSPILSFLCFQQLVTPPKLPPPYLTSFLFTLLTNQPSSSYSPFFHYPCCVLMLLLITIHSPFFFHPSVYPQNWHSFAYGSPLSLFLTAAQSSWKASDETWQVNQPNTVEPVKHLDASRLTGSTLLCVVCIFCPLKKCFACHTLKLLNIWCNLTQCHVAFYDCKNTTCFILQTDGSTEMVSLPGLWQIQAVKILKFTDMSLLTAVTLNFHPHALNVLAVRLFLDISVTFGKPVVLFFTIHP